MSDEDDEGRGLGEIIATNIRPWNGFWSWKDKPIGELGAAREILAAAGIDALDLMSRGKDDPPDCECNIGGRRTAVEVTELVHEPTLKRSLKALKQRASGTKPNRPEAHFVWQQADLIRALQERIDQKDRVKLKGGPYERYILVITTDEMFLDASQVEKWLSSAIFQADRISDVCLGLAYEPESKRCPVFKLHAISRNNTLAGS
ncbi:MAG: hypothetical protein AB7I42_20795 [Bradyrhizobium sp.]|uniref:hypothetical protein n=1 Tax=Bradyrhizobium sp. TaxID=376 RepID=UPI003D0CC72F